MEDELRRQGLSCLPFPSQGPQVQSLVGELKSHMPCSSAKRKKFVPKGPHSGLGKGRLAKLGCHLGQHFVWLVLIFGLEVGRGGSILNSFSSGHGLSRHTHI